MSKDVLYTNGVIAARETSLLGSKLVKLSEMSAGEAFKALQESGFGRGAEAASVHEYEKLLAADARDLDAFIREYAPTAAERAYFLAPRDFHNAKALVKAKYTGADLKPMLAPDGLVCVEELEKSISAGVPLYGGLDGAVKLAADAFEGGTASGAQVGFIFENACFKYLCEACKGNLLLKRFVSRRADMTNILTAMRSQTHEYAANNYVCGGKLKVEELEKLFGDDCEKTAEYFKNTPYAGFVVSCLEAKSGGKPYTAAEKILYDLESAYLYGRRYELKSRQPFLYYVLRRRAESDNLRIIFVCLLAGMDEGYIKARLRLA